MKKLIPKLLLSALIILTPGRRKNSEASSAAVQAEAKTLRSRFSALVVQAKRIFSAWSASKAGTYGASVAYYTIFSIAPLLVIAISIVGLFLDRSSAQASVIAEVGTTLGPKSAEFIESLVKANVSDAANIALSIVGFVVLLIGATGVFSQLQIALDTIFEALPDKSDKKGWWRTIRRKLLSFGMVLSIGFLLLVSLALSAFVTAIGRYLSSAVPAGALIGRVIELAVSFGLISFFLALTYKILPSKRLAWKPALIGGALTGFLFTVSKVALGIYLGSSTAFTSYGAASALVLFVLWIYYMSQVFFFGAIMVRLYVVPKLS